MMAAQFKKATRPLVLAEGMAFQDPNAFDTAVAANLLCTLSPGSGPLLDFSNPMSLGQARSGLPDKGGRGPHGKWGGFRLDRLPGQPGHITCPLHGDSNRPSRT